MLFLDNFVITSTTIKTASLSTRHVAAAYVKRQVLFLCLFYTKNNTAFLCSTKTVKMER